MSAVAALTAARETGIDIIVDGEDLVISANQKPSETVLSLLRCHKPSIVAMLRPGPDGWSAEDWHNYFDERARGAEAHGRMPRPDAEAHASHCCLVEWLHRNPVISDPVRCTHCQHPEQENQVLLPVGVAGAGEAWIHRHCARAWHASRKAEAAAALRALGIAPR